MVPAETAPRIWLELENSFVKLTIAVSFSLGKSFEKDLRRHDYEHPENEWYENPDEPLLQKSSRPTIPQREVYTGTRNHEQKRHAPLAAEPHGPFNGAREHVVFDMPVPMIEEHSYVVEDQDSKCGYTQPVEVVAAEVGLMKLVGLCFHGKQI